MAAMPYECPLAFSSLQFVPMDIWDRLSKSHLDSFSSLGVIPFIDVLPIVGLWHYGF